MTAAERAAILDAEARGWLLDLGADPDRVERLTPDAVRRIVGRQYDGGWPAFVADGAELVTP